MNNKKPSSLVYGFHAVEALLLQSPERIQKIYLQEGRRDQRLQSLLALATKKQVELQWLNHHKLDEMVKGAHHQGIVAATLAEKILITDVEDLLDQLNEPAFLLILDGVQDPHNLGACLRSANAAGVHAVIAPKDRAVAITPVVRKVASGAAELTPFIQVTNLARTMRMLQEQGIWLYGAAEEAEQSLYQTDLRGPLALVLGAEGDGLRRLTREHCDKLIKIPSIGTISSLNVSVAASICMFEALRQRNPM